MTTGLKPLPWPQHTVYYGLPMQLYMNTAIKYPMLKALGIVFDDKASRVNRLKALKKLWDAFVALKGLPEPTKENTWHPNTYNLIDLRDWICHCCHLNSDRMNFIRRVMNFVIILYDFDPPWRWIMDSVKDKAFSMEWKTREFGDEWSKGYKWWFENEQ